MTGETVLMYNCSGPEWAKLRQIFLMLRVRIRQVAPKCVDERCNAENAARKCGVFTYNAPLLE